MAKIKNESAAERKKSKLRQSGKDDRKAKGRKKKGDVNEGDVNEGDELVTPANVEITSGSGFIRSHVTNRVYVITGAGEPNFYYVRKGNKIWTNKVYDALDNVDDDDKVIIHKVGNPDGDGYYRTNKVERR